MRPIHPILALAGAAVVLATGYAWGSAAAADTANPFINTKVLATSGVKFVEGPDADPPPWPSNAPKAPPASPASDTAAAQPSVVPALVSVSTAQPETQRVTPAQATAMAMNTTVPSSALSPVSRPPVDPTVSMEPSLQQQPVSSAVPDDTRFLRQRPRRVLQKEVTFATTHEGQPVTIIWNN